MLSLLKIDVITIMMVDSAVTQRVSGYDFSMWMGGWSSAAQDFGVTFRYLDNTQKLEIQHFGK